MTDARTADELVIHAGAIVALRLFDVAYSIDLARVEAIWHSCHSSDDDIGIVQAKLRAVGQGYRFMPSCA